MIHEIATLKLFVNQVAIYGSDAFPCQRCGRVTLVTTHELYEAITKILERLEKTEK